MSQSAENGPANAEPPPYSPFKAIGTPSPSLSVRNRRHASRSSVESAPPSTGLPAFPREAAHVPGRGGKTYFTRRAQQIQGFFSANIAAYEEYVPIPERKQLKRGRGLGAQAAEGEQLPGVAEEKEEAPGVAAEAASASTDELAPAPARRERPSISAGKFLASRVERFAGAAHSAAHGVAEGAREASRIEWGKEVRQEMHSLAMGVSAATRAAVRAADEAADTVLDGTMQHLGSMAKRMKHALPTLPTADASAAKGVAKGAAEGAAKGASEGAAKGSDASAAASSVLEEAIDRVMREGCAPP